MRRHDRKDGAGKDWRVSLRESSPHLGLGFQIALTMLFFVGGGYLIDEWLATFPGFTIGGSVLGFVSIFAQIFRVSAQMSNTSERHHREKKRRSEK